MNIKLNIVGTVNRSNLKDLSGLTGGVSIKIPKDAKYGRLNPSGEFIELFYKIEPVKYNDGEIVDTLQFLSSYGIWFNSDIKNVDSLKFLEIIE